MCISWNNKKSFDTINARCKLEVCTTCSRTRYKIFPLTNVNKYLHYDTRETEVGINISVNNGSEKCKKKNPATSVRYYLHRQGGTFSPNHFAAQVHFPTVFPSRKTSVLTGRNSV